MLADLMVLVAVMVGFLTLMCFGQALASPRVFGRLGRRILAASGFLIYGAMIFTEAAYLSSDDVLVDFDLLVRWCAMLIMPALCFWLMRKLELERTDRPLKHPRVAETVHKASQVVKGLRPGTNAR